jgi:predicted nucleotidyltransferase
MALKTQSDAAIDRYRIRLAHIFEKYITADKAEVYLYGSRARGSAHPASDIDLALKCANISAVTLSKIREALHESHIPFKVDLINWETTDKSFQNKINEEGVLIWEH